MKRGDVIPVLVFMALCVAMWFVPAAHPLADDGGAMIRRADYNLARMSGMLDLLRDAKAKHFLPRWL